MNFSRKIILSGMVAALVSGAALAKVPPEVAAKLGDSLTPIGAEKAGNAEGTIPAWNGGLKDVPSGDGLVSPFPDEQPKFVIDQSNVDQYADKLSDGQVAMIRKYDTYKIPVYETHRTSAYEEEIYEVAKQNALNTELVPGGNGLEDFEKAFAFPIPGSGLEVVWNHITRWRGGSMTRRMAQVTPLQNGSFTPVIFEEAMVSPTELTDYDPKEQDNILLYFKQSIESPSRLAGNVLLVHETINQVKEGRRAWMYNSGQRRVRRAPQVAYDGPGTAADGLRTTDNFDMFSGAPDRYNWKLIGKKEMYIPYNSYELLNSELTYDDVVKPGHLNQDLARYELHRVWHVEATLKDDARHVYGKRVMYFDEDTWNASVIDHYDGRGELWRVAESHNVYGYENKVPFSAVEALYDLLSGRYLALGLTIDVDDPYQYDIRRSSNDFTPAALRRQGR
ncbi:MAG: outer membrane lipoprotein-sorting protein [Alteromonadaceae bacterium]|nr:outer membrane lipoprotein-sorting protein [Alteromonadaceae bacterium]